MKRILFVPKRYLLLISGIMWSSVGFMLISLATSWLELLNYNSALIVFAGIIPGIMIGVMGFSKIVNKNITRIEIIDERVLIFNFQSWQNYLLIVIMMTMGIVVRQSSFIPLILKTPVYFTIGTALSLSSLRYYRAFYQVR